MIDTTKQIFLDDCFGPAGLCDVGPNPMAMTSLGVPSGARPSRRASILRVLDKSSLADRTPLFSVDALLCECEV
jgi:hypothetical protein